MKRFFFLFWQVLTYLRGVFANLLTLLIVVFLLYGILGHEDEITIPKEAVLYVDPEMIVEQRSSFVNPLERFTSGMPSETVLRELISAIQSAANDDHIKAMVINIDKLGGNDLAKLDSVAQAISTFKKSKKPVIAIGDNFSQGQYFIASQADKIYLNPMGSVHISGFSAYQNYAKELLDKLAIKVHIFRAGEFKSFIEPFVRNDMSVAARENLQQWMDQQWAHYAKTVEKNRKLPVGAVNNYVSTQNTLLAKHANNAAAMAKTYGLVDGLATRVEAKALVDALVAKAPAAMVDIDLYSQHLENKKSTFSILKDRQRIAVIYAAGDIVEGDQPAGGVASSEVLIGQIHSVNKDEQVAAVVLRIDSPGGSAFASELIRTELVALQASGKPLVVSMGGVAASGGYWIAASADEIWAQPSTITGSIGVFGIIPTLEKTLSNLGVHSDGYSTVAPNDSVQLDRPLSPMAAQVMQQGVDFTYAEFLRVVSAGRKSTPAEINRIAQGRVWTGTQAHALHLVDRLGDLDAAILSAAHLAKLTDYKVDYIEPTMSQWEILLQGFTTQTQLGLKKFLGSQLTQIMSALAPLPVLSHIQSMNDPNHVYVRCWECSAPLR